LGEIGRWESFDTPVVVDATGYHGNLAIGGRTRQFSDLETSKLGVRIAMRSVNLTHQDPVLRMFFFPGGYGGIQPVDGGKYNLCMLVVPKYAQLIKQSSHNFLRESLGKNPQALPLLDEFEPIGSFQTTVFNIRKPESTGLLAVGDAMLTVDPATGSGMSIALQTGILAADVIAHGLRQKVSYEAMCQEFQRSAQAMLGRRLRFLRLFRPYFFSNRVQDVTYPVVKTFLPLLTRTFR
jgi:menaquinone-9 beta-reductase